MPETPGAPKQEIKLFYCYAHEDKALRDELQVNLAGLRRQYQLTNWYDREILPGEEWEEAIDKHLSTADVILLLISPHFVDSDYCYGKEMQRALERHHAGSCCVIPILLRPTYWEDTPLRTIQMLPTDARPITSWPDRYEAFHDVARGVSTSIKALMITRSGNIEEDWLNKGIALHELKRYVEAITAFDQALHLNPNDATAYIGKGKALSGLKRYKEALTAYEQALGLDPNNTFAYTGKIEALSELKQHEKIKHADEQQMPKGQKIDNESKAYSSRDRQEATLSSQKQSNALILKKSASATEPLHHISPQLSTLQPQSSKWHVPRIVTVLRLLIILLGTGSFTFALLGDSSHQNDYLKSSYYGLEVSQENSATYSSNLELKELSQDQQGHIEGYGFAYAGAFSFTGRVQDNQIVLYCGYSPFPLSSTFNGTIYSDGHIEGIEQFNDGFSYSWNIQ